MKQSSITVRALLGFQTCVAGVGMLISCSLRCVQRLSDKAASCTLIVASWASSSAIVGVGALAGGAVGGVKFVPSKSQLSATPARVETSTQTRAGWNILVMSPSVFINSATEPS
jgi:hypothetical protein